VATGCAGYEFDIAKPPDLVRHIGSEEETNFTRGPLAYRLRAYQGRLVVRIFNHTAGPIRLVGEQSGVFAPDQKSHPLPGQMIAPGSFIKLILPPPRPWAEPIGPSTAFGSVGGWPDWRNYDDPWSSGFYYGPPGYYSPPGYTMVDTGNYYWDWDGPTDMRLTLTFQTGDAPPFSQEFLFHRRKV
jgi:hypothetical protein